MKGFRAPFPDADSPYVNDHVRRVEAATPLAQVIAAYVPSSLRTDVWQEVAAVTREVVGRVSPKTHPRTLETLRDVAQFLAWCHVQGLPVGTETSCTPDVVEYYIAAGTPHLSVASRATRRAQLRRIGRTATTNAPWPAPSVPVLDDCAALLWDVAAKFPGQALLGVVAPVSDCSRLWHLTRHTEMPRGVARPESQRLKTTWIVRLATHGVPLQEVMVAAGYSTFRPFNNLAAHLPRHPPEVVAHGCGITVTVHRSDHQRDRQRLPWQSTAWFDSYGRRVGVESLNASVRGHHATINRGYIRIVGLPGCQGPRETARRRS